MDLGLRALLSGRTEPIVIVEGDCVPLGLLFHTLHHIPVESLSLDDHEALLIALHDLSVGASLKDLDLGMINHKSYNRGFLGELHLGSRLNPLSLTSFSSDTLWDSEITVLFNLSLLPVSSYGRK